MPLSFCQCVNVEGVLTFVYPFRRNVTYLNPPAHKHIPEPPEGVLLPGKVAHVNAFRVACSNPLVLKIMHKDSLVSFKNASPCCKRSVVFCCFPSGRILNLMNLLKFVANGSALWVLVLLVVPFYPMTNILPL